MGITVAGLLVNFGAGVIGAAYGGIGAFILCGILGLIGIGVSYVGGPEFSKITQIAFYDWLGPHITFTSGVIAAAYAAKKGLIASAKDVLTPLVKFNDWTIIAVGGISGVFLHIFFKFTQFLKVPTDLLALTIVFGCILARLIFGNTGLFGKLEDSLKEQARPSNLWGRWLATENTGVWLPWQRGLMANIVIGFGFGVGSASVTAITGNPLLGWCIAAVGLTFLMTDRGGPVAHHIALPAAYGFMATQSILIGGLCGIVGSLICEFVVRAVHNHGDTHLDGPSASICVTTTIFMIFFPKIFG